MVARNEETSSESLVKPRSGLAMARTTYPSPCRRSTSPFQLDASAQAPCTNTMVGFTLHAVAWPVAAAVTDDRVARPYATLRTTATTATSAAIAAKPRCPLNLLIYVSPRVYLPVCAWEHP